MPIVRTWNNVIDADEIILHSPIESHDLEELGFPGASDKWLSAPADKLESLGISQDIVGTQAMKAAHAGHVALHKFEPEDTEFETPRWYVVFETTPLIGRRLDLTDPDWSHVERSLHFSIPEAFVSFAQSWPGLCIGSLDAPAFLMPSDDWLRHESLTPFDGQGRPLIDEHLLQELKGMLLFQIDYWAKAKLLDDSGTVWDFKIDESNLASTKLEFSVWLENELLRWRKGDGGLFGD